MLSNHGYDQNIYVKDILMLKDLLALFDGNFDWYPFVHMVFFSYIYNCLKPFLDLAYDFLIFLIKKHFYLDIEDEGISNWPFE